MIPLEGVLKPSSNSERSHMLKELRIFNIILIESCIVNFQKGLNVITGETGSGKSAVIHALGFIAGLRADISLIRKGCDKGAVEAAFEISHLPRIQELLESAGIDHESETDLIIRREIATGGKSRAFINNQMVQVSLLKQVGEQLIGLLGQHANQNLLSTTYHRKLVNIFGGLEDATQAFGKAWNEFNKLSEKLISLQNGESERLRAIDAYTRELEELDQSSLKEGEEEDLFSEYTLLTNSEELATKSKQLSQGFIGDRQSLIPQLLRQQRTLQELIALDPSLSDCEKTLSNAIIELQEIAHTLSSYQARVEYNPEKIQQLSDRLGQINTLKRKYGSTVTEIISYRTSTAAKLEKLHQADFEIEEMEKILQVALQQCNDKAVALTQKRTVAAAKFQNAVLKQLRTLNMPKVDFHVEISPQKRDPSGDDFLEFFLQPNVGESKIALKGCASGGELSRILLALHTILAGKEKTPTLVFDEIDSNIGGETASVVGEKLQEISSKQQVLCITHFPQVARKADLHLQISKLEKSGRTLTEIQALDDSARQRELARMLGGSGDLLDAMALLL